MSRYIVIEGNLTETPALGYGQDSGKPYTRLNVAVSDRIKQADDDTYTDGPVTLYRVAVFGSRAENAAASFTKGDTVIVAGDLRVEGFTRTDGTQAEPTRSPPTPSAPPSATAPSPPNAPPAPPNDPPAGRAAPSGCPAGPPVMPSVTQHQGGEQPVMVTKNVQAWQLQAGWIVIPSSAGHRGACYPSDSKASVPSRREISPASRTGSPTPPPRPSPSKTPGDPSLTPGGRVRGE
jgi:single-stranded DNA-binding protein